MNKLIEHLIHQATSEEYYYPGNGFPERRYSFDKVKFAELIARETFDWVVNNVGLMEDAEWQTLQKHFGFSK